MLKIGITGQSGFIGTHLYNTIGLFPEKYTRIPFEDHYFENDELLGRFVSQCDIIIHLAALNRHKDPEVLYKTNLDLVRKLISSCEDYRVEPYILFSSSTQEERGNPYGRSKREGRMLLKEWAERNSARFTGLIIPNVFGPFGNPFYNSVVATFCHQLTHNQKPEIENDTQLNLIYVGGLVNRIMEIININFTEQLPVPEEVKIVHSESIMVSELLALLYDFRGSYLEKGEIPDLRDPFRRDLFNTFQCYIDHGTFYPFCLNMNTDNRGTFVEAVKTGSGGQVSFSSTHSGVTRGNHFHTRKAERFAVIKGKARIEIRRVGTSEKITFNLDGKRPSFIDMPVWYTHNILNTGDDELLTIFWISEKFDQGDPDTWFEKV
jgi:UDP-2-acetamido-2,6-beta-L-arabino-hexul-4-ose reductase